jgi:hypothetical protein
VLLSRFQGTIDDWDPEVLSRLTARRRVIAFDNAGSGPGGSARLDATGMDQGPGWSSASNRPLGTLLSTETRVLAMDPRTQRAFATCWFRIRPSSGAIRREVLRTVARRAESQLR